MITRTKYFYEFLNYFDLAKKQQAITNLGGGDFEGSVHSVAARSGGCDVTDGVRGEAGGRREFCGLWGMCGR